MDKEILTAKLAALQPATKTPPVISTEPDSSDSDDSKSSDDDEDPITQLTTSFQSLDFNIDDEINLSSQHFLTCYLLPILAPPLPFRRCNKLLQQKGLELKRKSKRLT